MAERKNVLKRKLDFKLNETQKEKERQERILEFYYFFFFLVRTPK